MKRTKLLTAALFALAGLAASPALATDLFDVVARAEAGGAAATTAPGINESSSGAYTSGHVAGENAHPPTGNVQAGGFFENFQAARIHWRGEGQLASASNGYLDLEVRDNGHGNRALKARITTEGIGATVGDRGDITVRGQTGGSGQIDRHGARASLGGFQETTAEARGSENAAAVAASTMEMSVKRH